MVLFCSGLYSLQFELFGDVLRFAFDVYFRAAVDLLVCFGYVVVE